MATIYFTNNASTGDGSLRLAIAAATDGDVIAPDPAVFAAGETIVVALTSALTVSKSLAIDAGATRLRLERSSQKVLSTLRAEADAGTLRLVGVDVVGEVTVVTTPEIALERCRLYGNASNACGVRATPGAIITLTDCLVTGFSFRGVFCYQTGSITLVRTTIAGNGQDVYKGSAVGYSAVDSIVSPRCSEAGFVAPPPDTLEPVDLALPWEEWDLRLLPTSPYATGATPAPGEYDVEGNARGVLDGGATRYAVGAYEVVDSGVHIVTTTAFADAGSLKNILNESLNGETIYFATAVFPIGQKTTIARADIYRPSRNVTIDALPAIVKYTVNRNGAEVELDDPADALDGEIPVLKITPRVEIYGHGGQIMAASTSITIRGVGFDYGKGFETGFAISRGTAVLDRCSFTRNFGSTQYARGAVYCNNATIVADRCYFANNNNNDGGAAVYLNGANSSATLTHCSFINNTSKNNSTSILFGANLTAIDCIFINDVCMAANWMGGTPNGTFTRCQFDGGTIFAVAGRVAVVDSAASVLDVRSWGGGTTATITGDVVVETLNLEAPTTIAGTLTVATATIIDGVAVTLDGDDACLAITTSAAIGAATISHATRGYLATPPETDLSSATLTNVVACDYGAGITAATVNNGFLTWTATAPTIGVLVEAQNAGAWTTLAENATSYPTKIPKSALPVRLFDGARFSAAIVFNSCFWRITDWATFAATEKTWKVDSWAEYLGGGDADAYFSVQSWAIDPETSED